MGPAARFAPPLAPMAEIFALSAQPHLAMDLGAIDLIGRKLVHMAEYGLLFLLWLRALGWGAPAGAAAIAVGCATTDECGAPAGAAAIAVGCATTDEWHQAFVSGRHGSPVDVLIDAAGVAIAWALWRRTRVRASRARSR